MPMMLLVKKLARRLEEVICGVAMISFNILSQIKWHSISMYVIHSWNIEFLAIKITALLSQCICRGISCPIIEETVAKRAHAMYHT